MFCRAVSRAKILQILLNTSSASMLKVSAFSTMNGTKLPLNEVLLPIVEKISVIIRLIYSCTSWSPEMHLFQSFEEIFQSMLDLLCMSACLHDALDCVVIGGVVGICACAAMF